jgi:hypothetical protein
MFDYCMAGLALGSSDATIWLCGMRDYVSAAVQERLDPGCTFSANEVFDNCHPVDLLQALDNDPADEEGVTRWCLQRGKESFPGSGVEQETASGGRC